MFDRPRALRWALAALPVIGLLLVLRSVDALTELNQVVSRVGPWPWLIAVAGQFASYSARAARLLACDPQRYGDRFWTCLRLILVNNALNLMLPLRTGEASFPLLLRRWFGVDLAHGSGTLLWMRLLDLQVIALAALACVVALHRGGSILWFALMSVLAIAPALIWKFRAALLQRVGSGRIASLIRRAFDGIPDDTGVVIRCVVWSFVSWGLKLAVLGPLLAALADASLWTGTLGAIGGDLSTVLPLHSPGGFGSFEAGVVAFAAIDADVSPALLAAAVSFHLFVLGLALLLGAGAWLLPPLLSRERRKSAKRLPS
jgi:uncharacterized membrane protein YbhN (UPF0104 family)